MTPYERLEAWQLCHQLVLTVYQVTSEWPAREKFGLLSQVRGAAISVPANLAEGAAKRGSREFRRYIDISLGSLSELTYLLRLARDLQYLTAEQFAQVEAMRHRAGLVTWRLYQAIARGTRQ